MTKQPEVISQPEFMEGLRYCVEAYCKLALRAFKLKLTEAMLQDYFHGIGKSEPLKCLAPGVRPRRLTHEHRIVHSVREDRIDFLQVRYHY